MFTSLWYSDIFTGCLSEPKFPIRLHASVSVPLPHPSLLISLTFYICTLLLDLFAPVPTPASSKFHSISVWQFLIEFKTVGEPRVIRRGMSVLNLTWSRHWLFIFSGSSTKPFWKPHVVFFFYQIMIDVSYSGSKDNKIYPVRFKCLCACMP